MSWEIIFIGALIVFALVSFIVEKIPSDLTSMTVLAAIVLVSMITGSDKLPDVPDIIKVFANEAPITIAGLFIISAALEKCGFIDVIATGLGRLTRLKYAPFLFLLIITVAVISAFLNNTAVVVIFLPVVLSLAKRMDTPASKFLIPLSYASIFGGCCTAIGTSTNVLVSGILQANYMPPLRMFELLWVGGPLFIFSAGYIALFGNKLLPARETLMSILSDDERKEYIVEALVRPGSSLAGVSMEKSGLMKANGIRLIETNRRGVTIESGFNSIVMEEGDRLILACRPDAVMRAHTVAGIDLKKIGHGEMDLEQISGEEAVIVEGVIGPKSSLAGKTLGEINFRNRLKVLLMAVHRKGINLRDQLSTVRLQFGDTLLIMGTEVAVDNIRRGDDIILLDRPALPGKDMRKKMPIAISVMAAIIATVSLGYVPMVGAVLVGTVILLLTGCLKPKEGYQAIEWRILMLIYGMLVLGLCMESTGFARLLSGGIINLTDGVVSQAMKPMVILIVIYLCTSFLTEVLSNNATVVLMAPFAIGFAATLGVDPRPFVIAVTIAASTSFSTPVGYQTNTYVYGAGGYRFSDFFRIGVALNLIYFAGSMFIIPKVWPF